ncbi:MAG: transcription antitermination factor NusB [Ruminococcaceae bacterium]|nr:transcription antitermination factor NusB [Oscillospiraceae bacterium]
MPSFRGMKGRYRHRKGWRERQRHPQGRVMSALKRREARELLMGLLFESEFRSDESYAEIYATSVEERMIPEDEYIKKAYYTIFEQRQTVDELIAKNAKGWKVERLSRLSRSILRMAVYEMVFESEIPYNVTINEAVELTKKFDDPKARPFVNGVLNSVKNELVANGMTKEKRE